MKMKKYIILFAAAVLGASCSNLLDQTPTDKYTPEDLEKADPFTVVESMMNAAMSTVHSLGSGTQYRGYKCLNLNLDCLGNDLVVNRSGAGWFTDMYAMQGYRGATDTNPSMQWQVYYKYIWAANDVLKFVDFDKSTAANLPKLKMVAAQAYTLRAFSYYHLICQFQDAYLFGGKDKSGVPVYTKSGEAAKGRGTAQEVYARILEDLTTAIGYFEEGATPASKEGISIYVAYMTLARTALTMGDYTTAVTAANSVIEGGFSLMTEDEAFDNGFQKLGGPETIWGYKWTQNTSLTNNSFASHISATVNSYGGLSGGYKMIDSRLYDQISGDDWRKELFLPYNAQYTYPNGSSNVIPKYTNMKFNAPNYNQDEVYMRLSEAYFIKAEAQASTSANHAADYPGAQQTLYDILSTRIDGYVKSTKTGADLLDEIRLHKRIEMWGEGLEYFDNKRVNKGVDRTGSTNQWAPVVVSAGKDFTLRIPKTVEIERNPHISDEDNNPL